ncbi:hypothetical protein RSO01_89160 [Reyranella soli]|uniref:Uncharacterized protein n=1 Tax=Reyranella soli TaxID=1230389 RepID=A0A512NS22_9HYPH|nr:hypothetical protein RSO01_89160 [Reyranella soli]
MAAPVIAFQCAGREVHACVSLLTAFLPVSALRSVRNKSEVNVISGSLMIEWVRQRRGADSRRRDAIRTLKSVSLSLTLIRHLPQQIVIRPSQIGDFNDHLGAAQWTRESFRGSRSGYRSAAVQQAASSLLAAVPAPPATAGRPAARH